MKKYLQEKQSQKQQTQSSSCTSVYPNPAQSEPNDPGGPPKFLPERNEFPNKGTNDAGTRPHTQGQEKLSDEELMGHLQNGQLQAFEGLLHRHQHSVFRFVLRYTGNRDVAEDLVQDVFLRLFRSASSFEKRSRFTTWLYAIARNLCIDQLRKKRHRNALSLDQPINKDGESEVCLMDHVRSNTLPIDQLAHSERLRSHLAEAILRLTDEQREVFILREEGGLPFEEIAKVVKAPLNTVKSRMRYALQNLKNHLTSQGVEL